MALTNTGLRGKPGVISLVPLERLAICPGLYLESTGWRGVALFAAEIAESTKGYMAMSSIANHPHPHPAMERKDSRFKALQKGRSRLDRDDLQEIGMRYPNHYDQAFTRL